MSNRTLNTALPPREQLQHDGIFHPNSPLHYLLPLCQTQLRQVIKQGSHLTNSSDVYVTQPHQDFRVKRQSQPLIKRLISHIRIQVPKVAGKVGSHGSFLIDYRVIETLANGQMICTDAEQIFVWKGQVREVSNAAA